jgi:radical SAM superfamily enzyme YgiQ (UPF0313 family)
MINNIHDISSQIILATPSPVTHRTSEENLGLGYIAAVLRREGYKVYIIDGWLSGITSKRIAERILCQNSPLFIAFSCYRSNMDKAVEVLDILRRFGLKSPIIAGGFGPTFHVDEFLSAGFDIVSRGEGEETLLDLGKCFSNGSPKLENIEGISFIKNGQIVHNSARPLIKNLDCLPFPERDTMNLVIKRKTPVHILSARGCQAHCAFCSIVAFQRLSEGPQWRQRSIINFVDELEELVDKGARYFKVVDDSLIEPPRDAQWCKVLADEIQGRGLKIRLRGSVRSDRVNDDILYELKRAGFFSFSCGIENGSGTALKRMGKSATLEQNIHALELFKKYGIYVQAGYILFDHGTTISELKENYEFMSQYNWIIIKGIFTEMYAANGTIFTKILTKKNLIEQTETSLGNIKYKVLDEDAYKVYCALRKWHREHMKIYDMTIDPLSAPKALNSFELKLFHSLYMKLHMLDLDFMKIVIDSVEDGASKEQVLNLTTKQISSSSSWYLKFEQEVLQLYQFVNLTYDAENNPFIMINNE